MTDVSTDVSTHYNAHNHTNVQETETLHITNRVKFFFNIDFQRSKSGFSPYRKNLIFTYASSGIYSKGICGRSGIKIVFNYNNEDYVMTRGRKNVTGESSTLLTS